MTNADSLPAERTYSLDDLFEAADGERAETVATSGLFSRVRATLSDGTCLLRDSFPDGDGACCIFVRTPPTDGGCSVGLVAEGAFDVLRCLAGGWLLESREPARASYWIPRLPSCRSTDAHGRILREEDAAVVALTVSADALAVTVRVPVGLKLDCPVWRIPEQARGLCEELKRLYTVERARTYFWHSNATYGLPADLYLCLIDGRIYQNARAWPRKWKFCCELDAYGMFVWMTGLERATGKRFYGLLRRQILASVIARQSSDGGWYHGEWTDLNECHYRFHSGAVLLLENAFDEWGDETIRSAMARGAEFLAARTDNTDLGLWFLHDSLEANADLLNEMHRQTGSIVAHFGAWKPSYMLGKSPTNKMILNTHLDTTVALDRYRRLAGDERFSNRIESARGAARRLLALRPADLLFRAVYALVNLTLLPEGRASRLPVPVRALKRLTRMLLIPSLYRLRHALPRIVMPGGLIERHLSPLHFDAKYHAVNVMDLARFWRRFPDEDLDEIVSQAVGFAMRDDMALIRWWAEAKPRRMAVVAFADALFQLSMLRPDRVYRRYLAQVVLLIEATGLGLPPGVLGGDAEVTDHARQAPCPSPTDARLRVVNLSTSDQAELLVINPTEQAIELAWETDCAWPLAWAGTDEVPVPGAPDRPMVPARGWLLGTQSRKDSCEPGHSKAGNGAKTETSNHDHFAHA